MTQPATVAEVVERMRAIEAVLDGHDGVAVFNRVYRRVTEQVAELLEGHATFHDDAFMADLDIRFAMLWFDAHDAAADAVPKAWAPLFAARQRRGLLPIQFALAGMNAHIEHDLPVALVACCEANGRAPTSPGVRQDYEQVNDLLADIEAGIRRSFLSSIGQAADDHVGPIAHVLSAWNIEKAREIAWVSTRALWRLRHVDPLEAGYRASLAQTVSMTSRLLLTPLG